MKKIRLTLLLILIFSFKFTQAQYSFNVDSLVRDILIPLTPPTPQSPFLYEMSAHFLDDNYFSNTNNVDTFNSKIWYSVFSEMRNAAYDTSILPNAWQMRYKALNHKKNNVVPIGLFYADYHKLIDSVFTDSLKGVYFDWDDDDLWDVTSRTSSPYLNKTLFVGSTLEDQTYFKTVKFIIDTAFIFYNNAFLNASNSIDTSKRLAIDFGDGLGYKLFRLDTITNYTVSYPDSGEYLIKFALAIPDSEGGYTSLTYLSKSYFYVSSPATPQAFNGEILIPGLTVTVKLGCDNQEIRKPLIYLEGIDYFEDRHADRIYDNSIKSPRVVELLNYGYDLIIVDWKNSKSDLRSNAMRVVHLIDHLKCLIAAPDESNELFVLMGESMGGLIGRMALAYMESDDYLSSTPSGLPYHLYPGENPPAPGECPNINLDLKARKHNTRLYISVDAPHQGAISPIAVQLMYKYFSFDNVFVTEMKNYTIMQDVYFNAKYHLDNVTASYAAKQMLLQELTTGLSNDEYTANPLRDEFLETLYSLPNKDVPDLKKGYPQECKLVAISDGLLTQQNQQKVGNVPAQDGDEIVHIFLDIKSAVFGFIKTKRRQYDLHLYTVGTGSSSNVFTSDKIESKFKLRGCLRNFFKKSGSCWEFVVTKSDVYQAKNVLPLEVNSGGNVGILLSKEKVDDIPPKFDFFVFGYGLNVDYTNGNVDIQAKYLVNIIVVRNVSLQFQTDAFLVNHIPLHSALDFDKKKTLGWDHPLFIDHSDPSYGSIINSNFSLTPFDVYYAGVNTDYNNPYGGIDYHTGSLNKNMSHVNYFLHNDNTTNPRNVNLEIGDTHMYLENFSIVANSLFWPSSHIGAGDRNPYYSYYDMPVSLYMYSRSNPLDWNNKNSILKSNSVDLLTMNIINIEDRTIIEEEGYEPCSVVYRPIVISNNTDLIENTNNDKFILFPNPNNGEFIIEGPKDIEISKIRFYNSVGQEINSFNISINQNNILVGVDVALDPGFYYIRINYENKSKNIPIIIK